MLRRYSMLPGAGRVWENTLRRPLELEVIDSEQFSPRHGLSSRAKIYAGVLTPARPTTDIRSECFHLAFVFPADGVSMGQK